MIYLPFPILLGAALLCLVLDRTIRTRWLGVLSTLAALASLILVVVGRQTQPLPGPAPVYTWMEASDFHASAGLRFDGLSSLLLLLIMGLATICLWSLTRSVSPSLMGYGRLFGALLLLLAGSALALLSDDLLLHVFGWGVVALSGTLARRIVGALEGDLPAALTHALPAGLLLLGAVLLLGLRGEGLFAISGPGRPLLGALPFLAWLGASTLAMGVSFSGTPAAEEGGPLQMHGLILGAGLPLLAGYGLLRIYSVSSAQAAWPPAYGTALMVLGGLAALGGGAAALQSRHFGRMMGWQLSAQLGVMVLALGVGQPGAVVAAVGLLLNAALTTMVGGLALAALVRRTGSEDLGLQRRMASPLVWPSLAYGAAAASAVGFPPLWGFWSRVWLLDAAEQYPWLAPLLLLSGSLLGLSYLSPLAIFWRAGSASIYQRGMGPDRRVRANLPALVGAIVLLALSLLPAEVWRLLIKDAGVEILPRGTLDEVSLFLPSRVVQGMLVAGALLLAALLRWRSTGVEPLPFTGGDPMDPDDGTPLAPVVLGRTVGALSTLVHPGPLYRLVGRGIDAAGGALGWFFQIFAGRYYLTGVFVAMILLLIVMMS